MTDPAPYEIVEQRDVMVSAGDGVLLATNIYFPGHGGAPAGRFPAVVRRTPYGKDFGERRGVLAARFVPAGYAVVVQDVRGRYGSGGRWQPISDDGATAPTSWPGSRRSPGRTARWAWSAPPTSAAPSTRWRSQGSPQLAAMVPVDAMSNPGRFGMRHAGAFELRWLKWVLTLGNPNLPGLTAGRSPHRRDPRWARRAGAGCCRPAASATPEDNPELATGWPRRTAAVARVGGDAASARELTRMGDRSREPPAPCRCAPAPRRCGTRRTTRRGCSRRIGHGDDDGFWARWASASSTSGRYQDIPVLHVTGAYDSWGGPVANLNFPA